MHVCMFCFALSFTWTYECMGVQERVCFSVAGAAAAVAAAVYAAGCYNINEHCSIHLIYTTEKKWRIEKEVEIEMKLHSK